jgi:hypothetical protein
MLSAPTIDLVPRPVRLNLQRLRQDLAARAAQFSHVTLGRPAPGLRVLTPAERATVAALAEVYFPWNGELPAPADVGAADFVDSYIAALPGNLGAWLRMGIRALEWGAMFGSRELSRFSRSSPAARAAILDDWERSSLSLPRAALFSLKMALSMGYFEELRVRQAMGWNSPCRDLKVNLEEWL